MIIKQPLDFIGQIALRSIFNIPGILCPLF